MAFWNIGEFRSLGAEKEEKFYSFLFRLIVFPHPLKFMSLRGNSHSARSNLERILQLKTLVCVEFYNNMDCRVARAPRNDIQPVVLPTSQNTFTPDAQFAPSTRPFGEREQLFLSRQAKVTDAGEGLKNYHSIQHPPTPFGYCLGFASRSRSFTIGAKLLLAQSVRYPD